MPTANPIKHVYRREGVAMDSAGIEILSQDLSRLEKLGIGFSDEFLSAQLANEFTAMDAGITQPVTTPSNGTPVQFLQAFLPGAIKTLTTVRKADELAPVVTIGEWWMEEIYVKVREHIGTPQLYSDYGAIPLASFNETYEKRQIVRFELGALHTQLADQRASAAGTNAQNEKRKAVNEAFEMLRNDIAFNGFNVGTGATYGALNDPNLPAYVTVATGTGGDTTWASKTVVEIISDLKTAFKALEVQSGGNVDPTIIPTQLEIPLGFNSELTKSDSSFSNGKTAMEWLKDNYPRCSIVTVPQFTGADAGDDVFVLKAISVDGSSDDGDTVTEMQLVPAKMFALGTEQKAKGSLEAYTNALAGWLVRLPFAMIRYTGI